MPRIFKTSDVEIAERPRYWRERIADAYFPLDLEYRDGSAFNGELAMQKLGELGYSVLRSDALRYRRLTRHLQAEREESFLLTLPEAAAVEFTQHGRSTLCTPGSFILERSGEPYDFCYGETNALRVLKVPERALRLRIGAPDKLCAVRFDASSGAGALFREYLVLAMPRLEDLGTDAAATIGRHLLDLLGLALESSADPAASEETAVRAAHLRRIEMFVRRNLGDAALGPATIAAACGVSLRYLHRLFQPTGRSVVEYVRELRLEGAREELATGVERIPLATVAYRWGFSDQAQFCRAFKQRYGMSPGEARRREQR